MDSPDIQKSQRSMLRQVSTDPDARLHQRVDPLGQPQHAGATRAVKRELVAAIECSMAELREATLDKAALEKAKASQRAEGVVVAERDQRTQVTELEWRHFVTGQQPGRQVTRQVQCLLVGDLGGGGQRSVGFLGHQTGAVAKGEDSLLVRTCCL